MKKRISLILTMFIFSNVSTSWSWWPYNPTQPAPFSATTTFQNIAGRKNPNSVVIKPQSTPGKTVTQWTCSTIDNYGNTILGGTVNGHFALSWVNTNNPLSASTVIFPPVMPGSTEKCTGITIDNNGNVLIAGTATDARGQNYFAAARAFYNTTTGKGMTDFNFGTKGLTSISIAIAGKINNQCNAITIDNIGNIILAGSSSNSQDQTFFSAARLRSTDGKLDTKFQNRGVIVIESLGVGSNDQCKSVSVDANNNIILTGTSSDTAKNSYFAIAKIPATSN